MALTDLEFFKETRDYIKHEDTLINHRITWLITLQAFLFGAYGFSLTAEATFTESRVKIEQSIGHGPQTAWPLVLRPMGGAEVRERIAFVKSARQGVAWLGLASAFVMCFPLIAAAQSMRAAVRRWETYVADPARENLLFPPIIGSWDFKRGLSLGLVPVVALPMACMAAWAKLQEDSLTIAGAILGGIAIILLSTLPSTPHLIQQWRNRKVARSKQDM